MKVDILASLILSMTYRIKIATTEAMKSVAADETTQPTNFCEPLFKTDPCGPRKRPTQLVLHAASNRFPFVPTHQSSKQMPSFPRMLGPNQNIHWERGSHVPANLIP